MKNIHSILLVVAVAVVGTIAEGQQPKKVPRIGVLRNDTAALFASRNDAFRSGIRELGYVEGENIRFEYRYADGNPNRLPELAAELVNLKVDVIVVGGGTIAAAQKATTRIPSWSVGPTILLGTAGLRVSPSRVEISQDQPLSHRT